MTDPHRPIDCRALPCRHRGPVLNGATTCGHPCRPDLEAWMLRAEGTVEEPDMVPAGLGACPRGER